MKRIFLILFVWSFIYAGDVRFLSASENGMMSTFGETTFWGMNGVMETNHVEEMQSEQDFNGIRTEIEPQHEKTARGLNGVMDVFDPNTDALASAEVIIKKVVDVPAIKMEFFYPVNGAELSVSDKESLQKSLVLLQNKEVKTIYLAGYADPTGSAAYNLILSKKRAESVAKWLVTNGIPSDKIKSVGAGIDDNTENLQQARRVEISVLFK